MTKKRLSSEEQATQEALAKRLGLRLAESRKQRGLTQQDVAMRLELEPESVSRMERGVSIPSLLTVAKWADCLQTTMSALLADSTQQQVEQAIELQQLLDGLNREDRVLMVEWIRQWGRRLQGD